MGEGGTGEVRAHELDALALLVAGGEAEEHERHLAVVHLVEQLIHSPRALPGENNLRLALVSELAPRGVGVVIADVGDGGGERGVAQIEACSHCHWRAVARAAGRVCGDAGGRVAVRANP